MMDGWLLTNLDCFCLGLGSISLLFLMAVGVLVASWAYDDHRSDKPVSAEDPVQPTKPLPPPPHDCEHEWVQLRAGGWICVHCQKPYDCEHEWWPSSRGFVCSYCGVGRAAVLKSIPETPLPCPKCGDATLKAQVVTNTNTEGVRYYFVGCPMPECAHCGPTRLTRSKAISAWNRQCREKELKPVYPGHWPATSPCPKCRTRSLPYTKYVTQFAHDFRGPSLQLCCIKDDCDYRSPVERTALEAVRAWNRESARVSQANTITNLEIEGGTVEYTSRGTKHSYEIRPMSRGQKIIRTMFLEGVITADEANRLDSELTSKGFVSLPAPPKKSRLRRFWAWFRAGDWIQPRTDERFTRQLIKRAAKVERRELKAMKRKPFWKGSG